MIVEIEIDYDNSTNKRVRYMVRSDGYVKKKNLSLTQAKKVKQLLIKSINIRQKLRKLNITKDR
jgi:hypothetical protein